MRRVMMYVLMFLIYGILLGQYLHRGISIALFSGIGLLAALLISKIYKSNKAVLLFLFTILGLILIVRANNLHSQEVFEEKVASAYYVEYVVTVQKRLPKNKYIVETKEIITVKDKITDKFNILLYVRGDEVFHVGDNLIIFGEGSAFDNVRNPNGFNEFNYYFARGIDFKLYAEYILPLKKKEAGFLIYLEQVRCRFVDVYEEVLPEKYAGLMEAMLLGYDLNLNEELSLLFKDTGIYHIIVISGLHITMIAAFIMFFTDFIDKKYSKILVIFLIFLFCIFTGSRLPTLRACIMCSIAFFRYPLNRDTDLTTNIAITACILLIYNPLYLFEIGFLYSFCAVFSIALIAIPISEKLKLDKFSSLVISCIVISLCIRPLNAYFFYQINNYDFLANILLIPFVGFIIILGFIAGVFGLISTPTARFFAESISVLFFMFEKVCTFILKLPYSIYHMAKPPLVLILTFYFMLFGLACLLYRVRPNYKKGFKLLAGSIGVFLITVSIKFFLPKNLEITMLDVGQGDCIVGIKDKKCFVIDAGGRQNIGEGVLLRYLYSKGVTSIDSVFVSHTDDDHINGILDVIPLIEINRIFLPWPEFDDYNYYKLLEMADEFGIPVFYISEGAKIQFCDDIVFECLYPANDTIKADANNSSMVLSLKYRDTSFLFTGDIERSAENILIDKNKIDVDVLKVAHHGSDSSSGKEFLEKVSPVFGIVSTGENNIYNHPSRTVVKRFEDNNIDLYNTGSDGAIIIETNGDFIKVKLVARGDKIEYIRK